MSLARLARLYRDGRFECLSTHYRVKLHWAILKQGGGDSSPSLQETSLYFTIDAKRTLAARARRMSEEVNSPTHAAFVRSTAPLEPTTCEKIG
jgi:hypothetical protein